MITKEVYLVLLGLITSTSAFVLCAAPSRRTCVLASVRPAAGCTGRVVMYQRKDPKTYPTVARDGLHILVDVTKKKAVLYKTVFKGSQPEVLKPVDPWHLGEHSSVGHRTRGIHFGHEKDFEPLEINSYLGQLEGVIAEAEGVILVGHGHGKANLAECIMKDIENRRPSLKPKIKGVLRMDTKHTTQNQLLELARRHFTGNSDPRK